MPGSRIRPEPRIDGHPESEQRAGAGVMAVGDETARMLARPDCRFGQVVRAQGR